MTPKPQLLVRVLALPKDHEATGALPPGYGLIIPLILR